MDAGENRADRQEQERAIREERLRRQRTWRTWCLGALCGLGCATVAGMGLSLVPGVQMHGVWFVAMGVPLGWAVALGLWQACKDEESTISPADLMLTIFGLVILGSCSLLVGRALWGTAPEARLKPASEERMDALMPNMNLPPIDLNPRIPYAATPHRLLNAQQSAWRGWREAQKIDRRSPMTAIMDVVMVMAQVAMAGCCAFQSLVWNMRRSIRMKTMIE